MRQKIKAKENERGLLRERRHDLLECGPRLKRQRKGTEREIK